MQRDGQSLAQPDKTTLTRVRLEREKNKMRESEMTQVISVMDKRKWEDYRKGSWALDKWKT